MAQLETPACFYAARTPYDVLRFVASVVFGFGGFPVAQRLRVRLADGGFHSACWMSRSGSRSRTDRHRTTYRRLHGEIPEGCHLHHDCGNAWCFNPEHLRPLTPEQHLDAHRSQAPTLLMARVPMWFRAGVERRADEAGVTVGEFMMDVILLAVE